ncbi:hypothetical protein ACN4EK_15030 [Pantanalinema rosaneae CENA516]|uniref:hypothetical protein n=1 Tax=Pantanalinema rosaneae TaxID=1620701 RepID=UPI003D6DD90B
MNRSLVTLFAVLGVALLIGACGPTTTPVSPTPDATQPTDPAATPTPTATPSP